MVVDRASNLQWEERVSGEYVGILLGPNAPEGPLCEARAKPPSHRRGGRSRVGAATNAPRGYGERATRYGTPALQLACHPSPRDGPVVKQGTHGERRGSAPPLAKRRVELRLPASGPWRIVVVADTHSAPHPRTHALIAELAPHAILHAGDIGDLAVLDNLARIAPLFAIRGNIDVRMADLPDALTVDVGAGAGTLLSLLVLHIAVLGPRLRADAARLAREEGAGVVVCGHSHVPFIGMDRGLAVFNPGSIGPRRFRLPIVFGVLELSPAGLRMHHVDCETGERWVPHG